MTEISSLGGTRAAPVTISAAAPAPHGMWSSRMAFILAATGSAVGLGNVWKFPYITGENGGGAFVLVYLACIAISGLFSGLLADPWTLLAWHGAFMALTILVVARGVSGGLEKATSFMMPALFVILLILVGYAMTTGRFGDGFSFLFSPDFSKLSVGGVLTALGHAFFTLSLGMGVMMAYGSYAPPGISVAKTAVAVALMDTSV